MLVRSWSRNEVRMDGFVCLRFFSVGNNFPCFGGDNRRFAAGEDREMINE
jgi:hypothetical protein